MKRKQSTVGNAMKRRWLCMACLFYVLLPGQAQSTSEVHAGGQRDLVGEDMAPQGPWLAQKRKKKKTKKKKTKKKTKKKVKKKSIKKKKKQDLQEKDSVKGDVPFQELPALDFSAGGDVNQEGVLDLSNVDEGSEADIRNEILDTQSAGSGDDSSGVMDFSKAKGEKKKKKKAKGGEFDFGLEEFDMSSSDLGLAEQERFDAAMDSIADDDFALAAQGFHDFARMPAFADFRDESDYQLAKSLYKMNLLGPSLKRFKGILAKGPKHKRYRKAVEWLFYISRKMADDEPVLAELARFRNVRFPKSYQDEFQYLLAKYLFVQAHRFQEERRRSREIQRGKKTEQNSGFDFEGGKIELDAIEKAIGDGDAVFDFGGLEKEGEGQGSFDFGGGAEAAQPSFDFEAADLEQEGAFDFGGGAAEHLQAFDFGGTGNDVLELSKEALALTEAPKTANEAIRQGLELLEGVRSDSILGPKSRYLNGLLNYIGADAQAAVNSFQDVVRILDPRSGTMLDPVLREHSFLSLARIHYGHEQFDRSAHYYDRIDRDSRQWLTMLLEASWAYYRRGDYELALGNLLTLDAPFFEKEYFPEAQIVKAVIYFEACRYQDTRRITDKFIDKFMRVLKEVRSIVESSDGARQLYETVVNTKRGLPQEGDDAKLRIQNLAFNAREIVRAKDVALEAQGELDIWENQDESFRKSSLGLVVGKDLKKTVEESFVTGAKITQRRFEEELYILKGLLAQAYRIKVEIVREERETIERRLRGDIGYDEVKRASVEAEVGDEYHYWPYKDEYWRDELGSYQIDFSMCERSLAVDG
jgi:TolA-binding protein